MTVVLLQNQEFTLDEKGEELIALDESVVAEKGEEEAKRQRDARLKRWLSQISPSRDQCDPQLVRASQCGWEQRDSGAGHSTARDERRIPH